MKVSKRINEIVQSNSNCLSDFDLVIDEVLFDSQRSGLKELLAYNVDFDDLSDKIVFVGNDWYILERAFHRGKPAKLSAKESFLDVTSLRNLFKNKAQVADFDFCSSCNKVFAIEDLYSEPGKFTNVCEPCQEVGSYYTDFQKDYDEL